MARIQVKMISQGEKGDGNKTGYTRMTTKNKAKTPGRLEMKKFDPIIRQRVIFKESK